MAKEITNVYGKEILDSRGKKALEVFVCSYEQVASFQVPSGASTGSSEALELRDADGGMQKAISIIESIIKPRLLGMDVTSQIEIDKLLLLLDSTEQKTNLGGNTMIGVSVACAKLGAILSNLKTFEYLRTLKDIKPDRAQPLLFVNLINGGKHAGPNSKLAFQEYHIIPFVDSVKEALEITEKVADVVERLLSEKGMLLGKGDEGGFVVPFSDVLLPFHILKEACDIAGVSNQVRLSVDVAASSFYDSEKKEYKVGEEMLSKEQMFDKYGEMIIRFDVTSIEDPFNEDDLVSFAELQKQHKDVNIVGDDLTVTNKNKILKAVENESIKSVIIKPNQIGTLTETLEAMKVAKENGINLIVSHRSGETMDDFIADLAVAFGVYGMKLGSPRAKERKVKYDRLVSILS